MAKCYQLVGVPASGKSTWINNQDWVGDCVMVSTDEFVEEYAREVGSTYSEVFDKVMPRAVRLMVRKVNIAKRQGKDIIWDQTSTGVKARARKFNMLPDYDHIAVVFRTPEPEELSRRLASRPGKEIPDHVIASMISNFEMPTEEEGFKEIWFAS
jgi:predicted kinase